MDRQNSLFDAVVSQEPKAKQRKSKEKKRSYSIGKPEVTKSVPEIQKVTPKGNTFYSNKKSFRINPRRLQNWYDRNFLLICHWMIPTMIQ